MGQKHTSEERVERANSNNRICIQIGGNRGGGGGGRERERLFPIRGSTHKAATAKEEESESKNTKTARAFADTKIRT